MKEIDEQRERRRFVAESAREFLARHWPNLTSSSASDAVQYALHLADALEGADAAPWSRTLDATIDLQDSIPALGMHVED